jgi:hypothetical protein
MLAEKTKPAALGRHGGLRMLDRSGGLIDSEYTKAPTRAQPFFVVGADNLVEMFPSLAAARAFQRRARDE